MRAILGQNLQCPACSFGKSHHTNSRKPPLLLWRGKSRAEVRIHGASQQTMVVARRQRLKPLISQIGKQRLALCLRDNTLLWRRPSITDLPTCQSTAHATGPWHKLDLTTPLDNQVSDKSISLGYNLRQVFLSSIRQEYFSQLQDTTDALPCHIHLPVCL